MERETGTLLFSGPLFMGLSNMAGRGGGIPPSSSLSRKGSHSRKTCFQSFPSTSTVGLNRTRDEWSTDLFFSFTDRAFAQDSNFGSFFAFFQFTFETIAPSSGWCSILRPYEGMETGRQAGVQTRKGPKSVCMQFIFSPLIILLSNMCNCENVFFFEALFGVCRAQLAPIIADAVEAPPPVRVDAVPQDAAGPLESRRKM